MSLETARASAGTATPLPPLITVRNIGKTFGHTRALHQVSLQGYAGSVHAITGENGAGKSTLMKLLAGVYQPDAGELLIQGIAVHLHSPAAARAAGVSTVFQELTVLPNLTVAENLLLGREPTRGGWLQRTRMLAQAREVLTHIGLDLDAERACGSLSVGEQQLVEIAKGVSTDASVFIFDEPTAPLNRAEVDKLEALILRLKAQGKLVFYISHRLDEIFRLCDTVTVLKDGQHVATEPTKALTHDRLISLMVGRPLQALFPPRATAVAREPASVALDVRSLTPVPGGPSTALQLRRGEIVGIGGLEGQGQREIVRALAGVLYPHACEILRQVQHDPNGPAQAFDPRVGVVSVVQQGVGLIPEDRKLEGLYLDLPIADNLWLGALRSLGLMRVAPRDRGLLTGITERLQLRASSLAQPAGELSGGNQQKVMIGRWLVAGVDTLLIEQPTRGVDVGAKAEIYGLLREFVNRGGAVLAVSSDLLELIGLCDRVLMVRAGQVVGDVPADTATEESLLALALVEATP
ncbi:ribose transport system ATP-binding protein [Hydrogenophaga palleronii]|uniref:Ribose transport system ATP-binding protein n=1 Tax=Hydrogenophaga palleronii TaxID=65655 RepID=A0ABU1WK09_9BURK|nr:sugar ABC transporter ATP-binding protein [Hydrogenophaga palleronii]MDR7149407.1 ribose transport system ATP-binding protein [Hydrogenophaga palleronii]